MQAGEKWNGWNVVRVIGRGSFGSVYEIHRDVFGTVEKAALKQIIIPQDDSETDELLSEGYDLESISRRYSGYLQDIVKEYTLMLSLKGGANIVSCDDLDYHPRRDGIGWELFIRMELLTPLLNVLDASDPVGQAVQVGRDICGALAQCEEQHIIHRDIKPQNILLSSRGQYKLGDFGVAKVASRTAVGTRIGTFRYMAPEVYRGQPYGTAADIYSLGMVMYWLLNRRRSPFVPLPPEEPTYRQDEEAQTRRIRGEPLPPPADGSEGLKRIVLKACAFDPRDRYRNAREMLADLEALEKGEREQPEQPERQEWPEQPDQWEPQEEPEWWVQPSGDEVSSGRPEWGDAQWKRVEIICAAVCAVLAIVLAVMLFGSNEDGGPVFTFGQLQEATPEPLKAAYPDEATKAAIQAAQLDQYPDDADYVTAPTTAIVNVVENLRLRTGPDSTFEIVTQMPGATWVEVFAKRNAWDLVRYNGSVWGWCNAEYLTEGTAAVITPTPEPTATPEPTPVPTPEPTPEPTATPAGADGAYVPPTELGDDIFSGVVEYGGDLYRLPAPVSVFEANGWTVAGIDDFDGLTIVRGEKQNRVFIKALDGDETRPVSEWYVYAIIVDDDPGEPELILPREIRIGMDQQRWEEVLSRLTCEVDVDKSYDSLDFYRISQRESRYVSIDITVEKETGLVWKIYIYVGV